MILVHGFGPYFGLPDGSPFVMKTMAQLRMAGLSFGHRASGVAGAPHGKVPYIEDDGVVVGDSTIIRSHIERKYGVDLDGGLSPGERAIAWSIEKMAEEHLYFALIDLRWRDRGNFAAGPTHFFDRLPAPVRPLIRRIGRARMNKTLYLQGLGRLPRQDVEAIAVRDIEAIATLLADQPFLMGKTPSAADGFVFGVLASLLVPVFETRLRARIEADPKLMAYVSRVRTRLFEA